MEEGRNVTQVPQATDRPAAPPSACETLPNGLTGGVFQYGLNGFSPHSRPIRILGAIGIRKTNSDLKSKPTLFCVELARIICLEVVVRVVLGTVGHIWLHTAHNK